MQNWPAQDALVLWEKFLRNDSIGKHILHRAYYKYAYVGVDSIRHKINITPAKPQAKHMKSIVRFDLLFLFIIGFENSVILRSENKNPRYRYVHVFF